MPRVAASSYLNTAPLIWSFAHGAKQHQVQLVTDAAPARCADLLARAAVDIALVPVIEYQRIPEIPVVPDVCIGARQRVRSVVLVTAPGAELKDIQHVRLDPASRTSAALVQIIFREFLGGAPQFTAYSSGQFNVATMPAEAHLEPRTAWLVIGDPAMMLLPQHGLAVYDLASLWHQHTGLGFVFAMWMVRHHHHHNRSNSIEEQAGLIDFAAARDEGVAHIDEIIDQYGDDLRLPHSELQTYLRENILFSVDEEMRAGLDLYYMLAHKYALTPGNRRLQTINSALG